MARVRLVAVYSDRFYVFGDLFNAQCVQLVLRVERWKVVVKEFNVC